MTINTWNIISQCANQIRFFVNAIYPAPEDLKPWEVLDKYFSIKTDNDWNILCSAMDLLEDTESAKENYMKFGLDGPTKYDEIGEKYLRLYGLLNALYLQKDAVIALLKYCNLSNLKKEKEEIENLKIIKLRHIAGSHTLNYKDYSNKKSTNTNAYFITRISLSGNFIEFRYGNEFEEINIKDSLYDFNKLVGEKIYIVVKYLEEAFRKIDEENNVDEKLFMEHLDDYFSGGVYTSIETPGMWKVGDLKSDDNVEIFDGK
jgi:hypothetical protein